MTRTYRASSWSSSSPRRAASISASRFFPVASGLIRTDRKDPVGQQLQRREPQVLLDPPQQVSAGAGGPAPVLPVIEVPVREQQPAFLQARVELPGQRLLPASLGDRRSHRGQGRSVRGTLSDDHQPHPRERPLIRRRAERVPVRRRVRRVQLGTVDAHQPPPAKERAFGVQVRGRNGDLREQLRHRLRAEPLPRLGDRSLRRRFPPLVPAAPRPQRPRQQRHDLLIILRGEQRQGHNQVNHHMRRQLAAPPPHALPRRLNRVIDRIPRHPRRQHPQRHEISQRPPGHDPSFRHDQRSCTRQEAPDSKTTRNRIRPPTS